MSMKQYGSAIIMGVLGNATLVAQARALTGATPRRTTPVSRMEDGENNVIAKGYSNPRDSIEIEVCPVASVTAGVVQPIAANTAWMPAPGALVTLANMSWAYMNGDWNFEGEATPVLTKGGPGTLRLTLTREGAPDNNGHPTALAVVT